MEKDENYYENLDKRTKEYKQWKAKRESAAEGFGDTIEKITEATGIKAVVAFLAGEDCGCEERKAKLNKILPFNKPECFTEEEYFWLSDYFKRKTSVIDRNTQKQLVDIYNRVFRRNQRLTTCSSCIRQVYNDLKRYFDNYNS